jgi:hypothetical protein
VAFSILVIGNDAALLNTRALLLKRESSHVEQVCGMRDLYDNHCEDVVLAVLCHTLGEREQREAIRVVRANSPTAMILILLAPNQAPRFPEHASVSISDGPGLFLTVSKMLEDRIRAGQVF